MEDSMKTRNTKTAPTQKEIDEAIENCHWRITVQNTSVCGGNVLPCRAAIDKGLCEALIALFNNGKETK